MATAKKPCFMQFLLFLTSPASIQMSTNFELVYMNISNRRHSNSNFAQNFVIDWLLQNGTSKNQHQYSFQRETVVR